MFRTVCAIGGASITAADELGQGYFQVSVLSPAMRVYCNKVKDCEAKGSSVTKIVAREVLL